MKTFITPCLIIATIIGLYLPVKAQPGVQVREVTRTMPTYIFSDPNPVPKVGRIYPYFRFDGYTAQSKDKEWKFIELENDYIKVLITPEIGGKIWGAIEKSTGKEFIYFNHSVKFRDVAMRGPWTSGGIESNFGAIGHAPTCSTPVDYYIRKNEDGSVSCFIGAIDLPSRTEWQVEINLRPDKSWFSTKASWHNPTTSQQSYYQWMNAAVKTAGNLEYAYPGTNYIGHDGSLHAWPIHPDGMDISWYEKNNFGGYKSYHVIGELTNFFGGYWHDDGFGFGHYSNYAGKPGKKLWIWGLARQGTIWEDLLTDTDGQYTEIQSGRLFNQEANTSIQTPFKHRGFSPLATDVWTEYWFPIMTTHGVVQASPKAALNLEIEDGSLQIWLSANEIINDSLVVQVEGKTIGVFNIGLSPTEVLHKSIPFTGAIDQITIKIGPEYIIAPGGMAGQKLSRPLTTVDFDWQSVQGLAMKATAREQERSYTPALELYLECLDKDPNYLPALVGAAGLYYRSTAYRKALEFIRRALAIDTYYPAANFMYGALNEELGNATDAIDGYAIASAAIAYKSAAFLGLSRIYFKRGEFNKSIDYANKSLAYNTKNISATELLLLSLRKSKNSQAFQTKLNEILKNNPLSHFSRFENYLITNNQEDLASFKELIRNELPYETYLEIAIKYYNLGLDTEASMVLAEAPAYPIIAYWLAYLNRNIDPKAAEKQLKKVNNMDPALVFPFRQESIAVLSWAAEVTNSWQPDYYLALIWWNLGNIDKAKELFLAIGGECDFSPFYLAKAELFNDDNKVVGESLMKAHQLSPDSWRATVKLAEHYIKRNDIAGSIEVSAPIFKKYPQNYYLGLIYAKALMLSGQNGKCLDLLQNLTVLPNEGATEGHHLHRITGLNLAAEALADKKYDNAVSYLNVAKSWPENLGVGKPYLIDDRIEYYLHGLILLESGKKKKAKQLFSDIVDKYEVNENQSLTAEDILVLAAFQQLGEKAKAVAHTEEWLSIYPDNPFVKWSTLWLNNSDKLIQATENINKSLPNQKIGSREYYLQWVINFLSTNPIK
jgi:tetratricopeptide (TPR) repeat protein